MRLAVLLALLAPFCGCATVQAPPLPAPSPTPAPTDPPLPPGAGLKQMEFFLGRWRCSVKPQPGQPALPDFIWTLERELRGAFFAGRVEAKVEPPEPSPWTHDVWGFDPTTGDVFRSFRDIEGGFGTVRSSGWEGDLLVFNGEAVLNGRQVEAHEAIQRLGPDRISAVWETRERTPGAAPKVMAEESCARLP